MKVSPLALIALMAPTAVLAGKSTKKKEPVCVEPVFSRRPGYKWAYPVVDFKHYLVGLLRYSHLYVPTILQGHTTGVKAGVEATDIPAVGVTGFGNVIDKTVTTDPKTKKNTTSYSARKGDYYALVDEGYGASDLSEDFPLHYHQIKIQKEFAYNHAGHTTPNIWDDVEHVATTLITDPDKLISWKSEWDGHTLDIQVVYAAPDDWKNDWVPDRVLTGRDFSPEGIATNTDDCGIIVEKWSPGVFAFNPLTGHVKSALIPTPDIVNRTTTLLNDKKLLTTISDKRHCYFHEVVANTCGKVDNKRIDENGWYEYVKNPTTGKKEKQFIPKFLRIAPDAGFVGVARMHSPNTGLAIAVMAATIGSEPGPRVYVIDIGDCDKCPPKFVAFFGFIRLSVGANRIAAMDDITGSDTRIVIHEHTSGFPSGLTYPRDMPADKLCIVNIQTFQPGFELHEKVCVLHYLHIADPYDTTVSGAGFYPLSQKSNGGLKVIDPWCVLIATDPGYPLSNNDYGLDANNVPFFTEAVQDTRYLIVCFFEPIFTDGYPFAGFTDVTRPDHVP